MLRVLLKITRGAFTVFVLGLCHPHSFNERRLNTAEEADEFTRSTVLKALEQGDETRRGQSWLAEGYWQSLGQSWSSLPSCLKVKLEQKRSGVPSVFYIAEILPW